MLKPDGMPRCDVPDCTNDGEWLCSSGFYYCTEHKRSHGWDGHKHTFTHIPKGKEVKP